MSIKEWPEGERPREKLLAQGAAALSNAELLAVLLRVGTQGMSAVDLARSLLNHFGSLSALMNAPLPELSAQKGMGMASFAQFAVVREIGKRLLAEELRRRHVLDSPEAVADYLRLHLGAEPVEVMLGLLLNQQHEIIAVEELSRGTVTENTVYIREIARLCLKHDAAALIVAHNHPAGSLNPSAADIAFTRRLEAGLALLQIRLLDHFIVTAQAAVSLRQQGLWHPETA